MEITLTATSSIFVWVSIVTKLCVTLQVMRLPGFSSTCRADRRLVKPRRSAYIRFFQAEMFHVKKVSAPRRLWIPQQLRSNRRLRSSTHVSANSTETRNTANSRADSRRVWGSAGDSERGGGDGISAGSNKISVNFDRTREVYKSKDSLELLRSLLVFKLCSYDFVVDKNKEVINILPCPAVTFWQLKILIIKHEFSCFMGLWLFRWLDDGCVKGSRNLVFRETSVTIKIN